MSNLGNVSTEELVKELNDREMIDTDKTIGVLEAVVKEDDMDRLVKYLETLDILVVKQINAAGEIRTSFYPNGTGDILTKVREMKHHIRTQGEQPLDNQCDVVKSALIGAGMLVILILIIYLLINLF